MRWAVVVAGGKGLRMGSELPKQFIEVGGKPILMHTLERFAQCDAIVLVLPSEHQAYWRELCRRYAFSLAHTVLSGGETRYHSVRSALSYLERQNTTEQDTVAIHDGVRPMVSEQLIAECFDMAERYDAVLPYLPMVDSLRCCDGSGESWAVSRSDYIRVQTPQVFSLPKLITAYRQPYQEDFTDDASVWEAAGLGSPKLIASNPENIKITTPIDLALMRVLLQS